MHSRAHPLIPLWSFLLALALAAMTVDAGLAQKCTDKNGREIACADGDEDKKRQQPVETPPTATFTPTPTATFTPKPALTNRPESTASPTPAAAAIVPPASDEEPAGNAGAGEWLPLVGILAATALGLGYRLRLRRTPGRPFDSAPHEKGRWLGLYHTFYGEATGADEGGTLQGDEVKDTGRDDAGDKHDPDDKD